MGNTTEEKKAIAGMILKQLGGNRFIAMTGAKNLIALDSGMSCKIGSNKTKSNYLRIKLNVMDTYDVEFISIRNFKIKINKVYNSVYFDGLREIFTEYTGMQTSL